MEKEFVTYEIALKLKELGFDESCLGFYTTWKELLFYVNDKESYIRDKKQILCESPLWQQVIDWIREKYKINCIVGYTDDDKEEFMAIIDRPNQDIDYNMNSTKSYEEAREQAILKAIEIIEKQNGTN